MEHRRRLMQHKIEQSTLLKIVLAKTRNRPFPQGKINDRGTITALVIAAIASVQKYDTPCLKRDGKTKPLIKKESAAVFYHALGI